ncbi:MAG: beta-eliminating lyase-related protein [Adlercreutzia equolifaciens]
MFFLTGGTQTNAVVISALLAGHEGVIAADTGHIAVHEAGAIEATGHKVLTVPECDGKLRAADVKAYLEAFYADASYTHMVFPGIVFIAHPSELGTLCVPGQWMEELSALCRRYQIPLYLDGARLAYAGRSRHRCHPGRGIARLADAFYIGGTKCGALCGEGGRVPARRHAPALPHPRQAARRPAGQGASARRAVRHAVHRRPLWRSGTYGRCGRRRAAPHPARGRVHLLPRKPHQSTVRGSGKCPGRDAGRAHPLQHVGKARGRPHRHPPRHQLVHHPRRPRGPGSGPARGDAVAHDASACRLDALAVSTSCTHGKPAARLRSGGRRIRSILHESGFELRWARVRRPDPWHHSRALFVGPPRRIVRPVRE